MIPANEFSPSLGSMRTGGMSMEAQVERAISLRERLDGLRNWRKHLPPRFRRLCSAGRLLFQVIGIAGYAGYFASMHSLMRFVSGGLLAGTWYAIYRIKTGTRL